MKKLILPILIITTLLSSCRKNNESDSYFESMNTFMKVRCYGENSEEANNAAQKLIGELETLISVTKPNSEIYKINHATPEDFPMEISAKTANLLRFTLNMSTKTDGALNSCLYPITSAWGFTKKQYKVPSDETISELLKLTDYTKVKIIDNSVTIPQGMMFDLGAVGKGFAGDEAIAVLKSYGIKSALLDLGGNIQAIGSKPDGSPWTIGIKNPFGDDSVGALNIKNSSVITSAGYERYFIGDDGKKYIHIFDGTTGRPVENEVLSATAIGENGTLCDALSTSLFVMGVDKSIAFWKKEKNFNFIIITKNKELYITKNIYKDFKLANTSSDLKVIIVK